MKFDKTKFSIIAILLLAVLTVINFYAPIVAQPGDASDPLVTRRFVEEQISQISEEVAALRHAITAIPGGGSWGTQAPAVNLTTADRDAIFAEMMVYFETVYGEMLRTAAAGGQSGGIVPFTTYNLHAGESITFHAGAEFILRSGNATVIAGANGIPDVTGGLDLLNGTTINHNHLLMIPRTDGRGAAFHSSSWIMVRGGYTINR